MDIGSASRVVVKLFGLDRLPLEGIFRRVHAEVVLSRDVLVALAALAATLYAEGGHYVADDWACREPDDAFVVDVERVAGRCRTKPFKRRTADRLHEPRAWPPAGPHRLRLFPQASPSEDARAFCGSGTFDRVRDAVGEFGY